MCRDVMARPLLGVPLLALFIASCGGTSAPQEPPPPPATVSVTLAETELLRVSASTWATGRTAAVRRVSPGTKILGRVDQVAADEGQPVRRGALLARLESRDLAAALAQAEAGVRMAEARLAQARAQEKRMRTLEARGSATAKNLEDAVAALRLAEAGLASAEADTEAARVMLSYAEVRSPIDGWVIARHLEAGDMAQPGMPLFVIEDLSKLEIHVDVPEAEVVGLAEGQAARVEVLRMPYQAWIRRIIPAGDPASRTFRVELMVDNPEGRLKSGMFARARFAQGERSAVAVPRSAVLRRGQLDGILVAGDDHLLRLRWITLGAPVELPEDDDDAPPPHLWVEVLSGLSVGERYVVDPTGPEADGAPYVVLDTAS